ncbi:hypothetical protein KM799_12540 [Clostridium tyrobutyricum]|uniref:Uncharacterized protein n=1 Tax=Clostridium luticellarii TaxID=1691940 RepID=A0A2T0BQ10_9CLOT|nr:MULTISPECIES: hypothetical protein [Clostridium]MBV4447432.1 hypothetical protein [Clostridium tyrobutyricum]PRR85960.1 hypothetical protein CLLU_09880 [Clostridium luticellarii]
MTDEKRKTFSTTIYPSISQNFKVACVKRNQAMNEILEKLMILYTKGEINLEEK